jgi:Uma2 family endonuclease
MIPFETYACHDDTRMVEWIDGDLSLLPDLSPAQGHIRDQLLALLSEYAETSGHGLVIPAPFAVRMPEEMRRGREPDLIFVPSEFIETVQEHYVNSHGVGIVVEVTDARSRYLDSVEKFHDYQLAGIPEYWLFDAEDRSARFFALSRRRYVRVPTDSAGYYHSSVLRGFSFAPSLIWPK